MESKEGEESYCAPENRTCCKVEALVSIDDRGQMVLPKELRELTEMVRAALVPVMKDIL